MRSQRGFTLVELMVAMAISGVVVAAIYTVFSTGRHNYFVQDQVAEMQQNLRSSVDMISREIRMAGFDPTGDAVTCAGVTAASEDTLQVRMDLDQNGDCGGTGEDLTFGFTATDDAHGPGGSGTDPDGVADDGAADLNKDDANDATQSGAIAENVEAVGFAYALDADNDGNLDESAGGKVIWAYAVGTTWYNLDANDDGVISAADDLDGDGTLNDATIAAANIEEIRAVKLWILARSSSADPDFTSTMTYVVGKKVRAAANDGFRRRLLEYHVRCRNMGL